MEQNFSEFIIILIFLIVLGIFGFIFLPTGFSSFDIASKNVTLVNSTDFSHIGRYSYLPLALILIMQFFITIGITTMPSLLTSEVFPFKWDNFIHIWDYSLFEFIWLFLLSFNFQVSFYALLHCVSWTVHVCCCFIEIVLQCGTAIFIAWCCTLLWLR